MLLFKELKDCLFWLLTILIMVIKNLKETVIEKYFLPRVNVTNYNVLINGKSFCDQPIRNQIKKYDKIRKIATGQRDAYKTGCLLDCQYFKDLSKQKELDADPRAIQQIEFYRMRNTKSQVCTILEKSKETVTISQRNSKSFANI